MSNCEEHTHTGVWSDCKCLWNNVTKLKNVDAMTVDAIIDYERGLDVVQMIVDPHAVHLSHSDIFIM